jgi:nucleotide-binding universal stress UspA family protein
MRTRVVVGVDGSPSAARAADLAGELAVRHRMPLEVVHVFSWPALYPPFLSPDVVVQLDPRKAAAELVGKVAATVGERYPHLSIETRIVDGNAAGALVDASRHAAFLVVGHRGLGGFTEMLIGSVGVHTTMHAHCPVLVVRGETGAPGAPVVVGVDGSDPARVAAAYAYDEARTRGSDLYAVLALPSRPARSDTASSSPADATDPIAASIDDLVLGSSEVKVHREVRRADSPALVISTLAREVDAGLVVVGSRGIGGFRGLLVGGTSRALVEHAPCPVLVIPRDATSRLAGGTS